MVSKWELGTKAVSPYYRVLLCVLFEMPAEDLGFLSPEEESATWRRASTVGQVGREYTGLMPYTPPSRVPRSAHRRRPAAPAVPASLTATASIADEGVYTKSIFDGCDLAGQKAESVEIDTCRMLSVNLSGSRLTRAMVTNTVIERSNLSNLRAMNSSLIRVELTTNRMTGISWTGGRLRDVTFRDCRLDLAGFRSTSAANVLFEGSNLKQADFQGADLRGVTFENCDLTGAQFSGADMNGTRLLNCVLVGVNGATSMAGAAVASRDMVALAYSLAGALGITVLDED